MIELALQSEIFREQIQFITEEKQVRRSECLRVDMMNLRKWRESVINKPRLKELPVEALPVMSDYGVSVLEQLIRGLTEDPVIINVALPGRPIPSAKTPYLTLIKDRVTETDDGANGGAESPSGKVP